MKKILSSLLCVLTLSLTVLPSAEAARSDRRQARQQVRIQEGRASGALTRRESRALRHQQRHIHRAERRARADGFYSPRERAKIERKQDRASRQIYRAKHNRRGR